jgi:peptidyl-prolyl cis-trans isomerase B (cyclophilin B)
LAVIRFRRLTYTCLALCATAFLTLSPLVSSTSFAQAINLPTDQAPLLSQSIREATDFVELRQFDRARPLIQKGLENNPRDPQWRFLEAMVLAETQAPDQAIAAFESLVNEFPELAEPYNNLAVLYLRLGQSDRAQQALERAIVNRPDYGLAHENLGDLYVQLALKAYEAGVRAQGASPFLQHKRDHLLSIPSARLGQQSSPPASQAAVRYDELPPRTREGFLPIVKSQTSSRKARPMVELKTSMGSIKLQLNDGKAPKTVANFLSYVNDGHFNGTIFHRVIDGFMIQGGGFDTAMSQKDTKEPIENEANNGLKNKAYTIAMARTGDPHSATAQFFINVADNDFLDHTAPTQRGWGYAVFGEVVEGQEVVDKIRTVKTTTKGFHENVPVEAVVIESASVVK